MYQITAIIEKGSDGMYSIRSEQHFGKDFFGGFGNTVPEAKEDFMISVREAADSARAEGFEIEDYTISFRYDMPSFFATFDFINASKFAQYAGINESKMRQYKSGAAYPGERTAKKILCAIHSIGAELSSVSL